MLKKEKEEQKKRQSSRSVESGEPPSATFVIFLRTLCLLGVVFVEIKSANNIEGRPACLSRSCRGRRDLGQLTPPSK